MTDRLASLLEDPARAVEVPPEDISAALGEVVAQEANLSTVKAILAARLAAVPSATNGPGPDHLLTAEEVHERTTLSVDWLYRHKDALPFCRRVGRKVLFSEAGLNKWLAKRAS